MKDIVSRLSWIFIIIGVVSFCMTGFVHSAEENHGHDASATMEMHHMHMMMNHGLEMVMQGANLVMLGEMNMSPDLDPATVSHGRSMMKQGRQMIQDMLSGPEMQAMHKMGHGNAPVMKYTHTLAEAMLNVVDMLEKMKMTEMKESDAMTMHHMHILINHALEMAAEGSSMVMLGQMGMANSIDKHSVEHGQSMLSDARALINEVMKGKAMTEMHTRAAGNSTEMDYTHKLAAAAKDLIDLWEKMPPAK